MQSTNSQPNRQSLMGSILIALGAFIFCANLDRSCAELTRTICTLPLQALGGFTALVMAAGRLAQMHAANRGCLFHILVSHIVMVVWPLLLIAVGAIVSKADPSTFRAPKQIIRQRVDTDVPCSTSK
jgi:hypothetical protein